MEHGGHMEQELENESSAIVEVSKAQVEALGERLARKLLDVSWEEALRKYSAGELQGSLAEIEISSIVHLLHFPRKPIGGQAPADEISPPHLRGRKLPQPWSLR